MINRDKWGAIASLLAQGVKKKAIARTLGLHIQTVRKWAAEGGWKPFCRPSRGTNLGNLGTPWCPRIAQDVPFRSRPCGKGHPALRSGPEGRLQRADRCPWTMVSIMLNLQPVLRPSLAEKG